MSVYIVKISFERRLCNKIRSTWPFYSSFFFCNFKLSYFNYLNAKSKYRRQFKNIVFLQGLDTKKLCDTQLEHNLCHQHKANRELIYFSIAFHPLPNNN